MEVVSALNLALAEKVGAERFDLWFAGNTQLCLTDSDLLIKVATPFLQDWLRKTFRREIESACFETLQRSVTVSFQVDPQLALGATSPPSIEPVQSVQATLPFEAAANPLVVAVPSRAAVSATEAQSRRRFMSLESYVVGSSNRLAHVSIRDVALRHSHANPLLIHGPTGVGKSHLLEGLWTAMRQSGRSTQSVFLSAEQFTSYFLGALHGSGLPSFRRKYRGLDLLIIDDLQFFIGKRATIVELLYTVDSLMREGRQVVFAADRAPEQLHELGPELVARLEGGLVCPIEAPDYETRLGVVERMCEQLGVDVPAPVRAFVASTVTTHARALAGALKRLRAASIAHAQPITLALAQESLADVVGAHVRDLRLADIEAATCTFFGLEPTALQTGAVGKKVNYPRMLAMWLARKHTRAALAEIGQFFGRRSHSTVLSAQKKINAMIDTGEVRLSVEGAIQRIEQSLRVG
jgi:chromosomal replication initiator protein